MGLEEIIKEKRNKCAEEIKEEHPEWLKDGEIYHYLVQTDKEIPVLGTEFLVWDDLLAKYYWRSLSYLKDLSKLGNENPLSDEDMKNIALVMIEQAMKGEKVASNVSLYSDVFNHIGNKESPLEKYVTDEHKKDAVNIGFWNTLKETEDKAKQNSACQEFSRILTCKDFFKYFDFKEGIKKAEEMPIKINLDKFYYWDLYMRWYLVQEYEIYTHFKKEKADDICGRLIAPLIENLLIEGDDYAEKEQLKRLANFFIRGDILNTPSIQNVLGEVFEIELENAFKSSRSSNIEFSKNNIKLCKKVLINLEEHVNIIWEKVKEDIDLSKIPEEVEGYIPKKVYESYVQELRNNLEGTKRFNRFNIEFFSKWMNLKIEKHVSKSLYGKVRNKALEIYFSQKPRPSGEVLLQIKQYLPQASSNKDKLNGFLFADLLLRRKRSAANNILMSYDIYTYFSKPLNNFYTSLSHYIRLHGKLLLDRYGLEPNACYPHYNKIVDFNKKFPQIFKIKN